MKLGIGGLEGFVEFRKAYEICPKGKAECSIVDSILVEHLFGILLC